MKKIGFIFILFLFFIACGSGENQQAIDQPPDLSIGVGEIAPGFEMTGTAVKDKPDKSKFTLSDAKKDGPVLLAFYPMAFTGG